MAIVKLEFDLSNPEQDAEHKVYIKAPEMNIVLFEINSNLKRKIEWKMDSGEIKTPYEAMDYMFDEIRQLMITHNLNCYDY